MTATNQTLITINVDRAVKQRLIEAAERQGVGVDALCEKAIERELSENTQADGDQRPDALQIFEELIRQRDEQFKDRSFSKTGVELIREGRAIRTNQQRGWLWRER